MRVLRAFAPMLMLSALPVAAQQPVAAASAAAPRPMQPNDWHRLATLGAPAMPPDGKRVAFTVTTVVERENKRHSEIWMVNTAGGELVRLNGGQ